jgi:hypothetical protein
VLLALCIGCLPVRTPTAELSKKIESHVRFLAGDSLEGRLVGTPGIEKAAAYIAAEFEAIGLEPVFDGSFFQNFEIEFGIEVEPKTLFQIGAGPIARPQFIAPLPISGSGSVSGELIMGWPSEDRDLTGAVVYCPIDPDVEKDRWTMMGRDGLLDWMRDVCTQAKERGAAAVVFVSGSPEEPKAGLHTYPIQRAYRPVDIPAVEITYWEAGNIRVELPRGGAIDEPFASLECGVSVTVKPRQIKVSNVAAMLRGSVKPNEYVVVGAHYDHLGYGDVASSTPWRREVHNGADDNASGIAALIEIARRLVSIGPPERSVVFVAFTAEELGAIGSEYYCKNPPHPTRSTIAMINLDTVGRLEDNKLIVFGARSAAEFGDMLEDANEDHSLELVKKKEIFGFSDQNPFYARGIPALHIFTGAYDDYHSPDDDWNSLNYEGLSSIASFVSNFVGEVAGVESLTALVELEEPSEDTTPRGRGASLGIVPDFTYAGIGVGIKGTVPGSPAEQAGLEDGDVILEIDNKTIADLKGLMQFLASKNPGDEVEIQIVRGSAVISRKATLSVRSGQR